MSDLTAEKLFEMMRSLPPRPSSPFDDLLSPLRPRFSGLDVFEERSPPAKIEVRQIYLADGTALLPEAFLREQNARWAAAFGYREALCKEHVYIFGGRILMSAQQRHVLSGFLA